MRKVQFFALLIIGLSINTIINAQITWPSAYTLGVGSYTFTTWPATSPVGTYPANMGLYRLDTTGEPLEADTIYQDYNAAYNIASGTRINGLDAAGFSFINTGNAVYKVGAAVLALNTTNRNNVAVTWTGRTVTPNNREYEIRLYYRIGNTGVWTPALDALNDTIRYVRSATAGDSLVLGPDTLPAAVNNQALVQLCWKYFQTYANVATGSRAELSINNVTVSSTGLPAPALAVTNTSLSAFYSYVNNTSGTDTFSVSGSNLTANVDVTAPSSFEIATSATGPFGPTLTLTPTAGTLASTKIYVRFHPTVHGIFTGSVSATSTNASTQNVNVTGYTFNAYNPPAYNLTTGTYTLNSWDSLSAAGAYPPNMAFHTTNTDFPPLSYLPMVNNWNCVYNLPSRPRILGLDTMGFAFLNTSNPQYDDCNSGATTLNTYIGAAILALKTMSVANIHLSFNAGVVIQGTGGTPRVYKLRLQYRLDSSSNFADVTPLTEYSSDGLIDGDMSSFSLSLPALFENIPYVQLRWLYYTTPVVGESGTRPEMRVDNIVVSATVLSVGELNAANAGFELSPNPCNDKISLQSTTHQPFVLMDISGRKIAEYPAESRTINLAELPNGMYFLKCGAAVKKLVKE